MGAWDIDGLLGTDDTEETTTGLLGTDGDDTATGLLGTDGEDGLLAGSDGGAATDLLNAVCFCTCGSSLLTVLFSAAADLSPPTGAAAPTFTGADFGVTDAAGLADLNPPEATGAEAAGGEEAPAFFSFFLRISSIMGFPDGTNAPDDECGLDPDDPDDMPLFFEPSSFASSKGDFGAFFSDSGTFFSFLAASSSAMLFCFPELLGAGGAFATGGGGGGGGGGADILLTEK